MALITDNLYALWKCDDDVSSSTVVAASVGSAGTLLGGDDTHTKHASGPNTPIPSAFLFNGTDDGVTIDGSSFASGAAYTLRAIVKFGASSGIIFGNTLGGFFLHKNSDTVVRIFNTAFTVGTMGTSVFNDLVVTRGTDNVVRVYMNGTITSTTPPTLSTTCAPTRLGITGATFLNGTICYASVWSRQLSQAEVTFLYNGGSWLAYPWTWTASTIACAAGGVTSSQSDTFTKPIYTASTIACSGGGATSSQSDTFTKPIYTLSTAVCSSGGATSSLAGTFIIPIYTATSISGSAGGPASSLAATFTIPIYTASTISGTAGGSTSSLAATFENPIYTATMEVATGPTMGEIAATFTTPIYTATAISGGAGAVLASAAASFEVPVYNAGISGSIGGATAEIACSASPPIYTAAIAVSCGALEGAMQAEFAAASGGDDFGLFMIMLED